MSKSTSARRTAWMAVLLLAPLAAAAAPSPAAAASSFTCDASALRAQVLIAPAIEPITANRGAATCTTANAGVPTIQGLPVPATARVLAAQTSFEGSDASPGSQKAGAFGGIADLSIGLPALPITLPVDQIPAALNITVPLPAPLGPVSVPIADQLKALAPGGVLPTELIGVRASAATATASCVNGKVQLSGSSQVLGLRVLGQEVPTNAAVEQALTVIGGGTVDPSKINVAQLVAQTPALAPLGAAIQPVVQEALDALPDIAIPAQVATLSIVPSEQIREGDKLTQRALHVKLAIANQSIADITIGEASVSAKDVPCSGVAGQQLACTTKRLALVDVLPRGNRVRLFGVADRALIGRRVTIKFTRTGATVGTPVVAKDGTFTTTAPLPARSIRDDNSTRYQAWIGRERSLPLKLARRMVLSGLSSRNGKVTISGRVIRPFGQPIQTIVVKRQISCKRMEVVARIKPSRTGAFRVTVDAPPKTLAATYRLITKVRGTVRNPKLFNTYTLPRAVEIR